MTKEQLLTAITTHKSADSSEEYFDGFKRLFREKPKRKPYGPRYARAEKAFKGFDEAYDIRNLKSAGAVTRAHTEDDDI